MRVWWWSFAVSAVVVTLSVSTHAFGQERTAMEEGAKTLGNSVGDYAGLAIARHVSIKRLTAELERCASCPQKADLERQLAALHVEDAAIKAVEGALLQSMGLRYRQLRQSDARCH